MAVAAKCPRKANEGCEFSFDDAEHIEDAVAKMRAHFRVEHPTKGFYENRFVEHTESYNCTVDEIITGYLGNDWRNRANAQQIVNSCQSALRYYNDYKPEIVQGLRDLSEENGVAIPDPFDPANAQGNARFDPFVDQLADAIEADIAPRFVDGQ